MLTNTRVDPATKYRCPWIEGLLLADQRPAGRDDRAQGQHESAVAIHDRHLPPGLLRRHGGRLMQRFGPLPRRVAARSAGRRERLRECAWETSPTHRRFPPIGPAASISASSPSRRSRLQSYVIFIVRDDRPCDFLFQCSDTTWDAYNRWPDLCSLYDDGTPPHNWYTGPGVAGQLRPALRQVLPDPRRPALARLGRVPALGIPARLLDGAAGLRRLVHLQRRHARRRRPAC